MVGYVATGIIFAVLESPKSFTGTRYARSCLTIISNINSRLRELSIDYLIEDG